MRARLDVKNSLATNGERLVQRCVLQCLADSNDRIVIFDVGANVGDWTLHILNDAKTLGIENRIDVHAFEPVGSTFETLKSRISAHPLHGVVSLQEKALSSCSGSSEMFVGARDAGTNSIHRDPQNQAAQATEITRITGDEYCRVKGIAKVHLMKCDAEGHDFEVLCGIAGLIRSENVALFQFEYNHRWIYSRHYLKDAFEFIKNSNYRLAKITPAQIEIYDEWHPELERFFEGNYLLVHESAQKWMPTVIGTFDESNTYC